jgi:Zn-dependent protease/CBS domain-containing protein
MRWSIRFARLGGIELKIHFTFLIFLAWIALTYYRQGGIPVAIQGTVFVLLLFACVLLHELGHALVARHFGVRTPDITLLPIGGVARLERIPRNPRQELLIAIAGPLVNVVIAAVLLLIIRGRTGFSELRDLSNPGIALMAKLASVNIFLVLFNLIPAFPMDGGRILRAILAMKMNYARATQVAANIGQALAFVFGLFGLFGNPMLLFIALFVYLGASQEASLAKVQDITSELPVSEAMVTEVRPLPSGATLDDAAEAVLRTSQHEFPVLDASGRVLGIITSAGIIKALQQRGGNALVTDIMHKQTPAVRPDDRLDEAFLRMQSSGVPALPVIDGYGNFLGLITPENVGEMLMIRTVRPKNGRVSWRPTPA